MKRQRFDLKEINGISVKFLYFFGILYPKLDTFWETVLYIARVLLFLGFFFCGIVLAELANLYLSIGNLREMMKALFLTLSNLISIGKFFVICKNQKSLLNLTERLNRKEFQPKSSKQVQALKEYIRLSKIISFSFYIGCTLTCGFWTIYPFTEKSGPCLPIAAYIPINTDHSTKFGMVYAYEIIATIIGGYTDLSADCLIAGLIMVTCAQFHILNDTLSNIIPMVEDELEQDKYNVLKDFQEKQKLYNQKLIECVKHHKLILKFAEEVSNLFSINIFLQFVVSVFIICATLFEMTMVPIASVQFFSMALYQYCMLLEIFVICYFGNEVIIESSRLNSSIYLSDWTKYSMEMRKNIIFFMTRNQKFLKLYGGGFFAISMDTFIKILKSSWSYAAVLLQYQSKL